MRGRPVKIGWLSSGRDPAARTLLSEVVRRARRDAIELDIGVVFCDRERGEDPESDAFLDLVADLGLPSAVLSSAASWQAWRARHDRDDRRFANRAALREAWREAFHDEVGRLLDPYRLDLLVLAGYMLIMSPDLCARFATLNLHPALPSGPQGTWQQVIWQLLADEADETGAMVHLATAELDRGPVVAYCSFPIVGLRWTASGMPSAGSATHSVSKLWRRPKASASRCLPKSAARVSDARSRCCTTQSGSSPKSTSWSAPARSSG